jgi:hypothetical protein
MVIQTFALWKYGDFMRSIQELTTLAQARIDAKAITGIDTEEQFNSYVSSLVNAEAKSYLDSTDWYVIRFIETEVAIPSEILTARANARSLVT